jgi:hypothetical protein
VGGALDGGGEVVALERLLGGRAVPGDRAARLAGALEVRRQQHGVALAGALEPDGGVPVRAAPLVDGPGGVGGLAHQRVAEGVLLLAGEARGVTARQHLLVDQHREPLARAGLVESSPRTAASAPVQKLSPRTLPARRRRRASAGKPSMRDCTMASTVSGSSRGPAGGGADQLLEVERVARGAVDEPARVARRRLRGRRR